MQDDNIEDDDTNYGMREDIGLLVSIALAILCLAAGIGLALTYDSHWLNRAGAAIVAVQLAAVMIEFSRRRRLRDIEEGMTAERDLSEDGRQILESEIVRSESQAFAVVVTLAIVGEILHGFGDLLFELVRP
jgi:hypothetical protein